MKIVIHREISGETKKIAFDAEFDLGDIVARKIEDSGEMTGMVVSIKITPNGLIYECTFPDVDGMGDYYDIELEKIK